MKWEDIQIGQSFTFQFGDEQRRAIKFASDGWRFASGVEWRGDRGPSNLISVDV